MSSKHTLYCIRGTFGRTFQQLTNQPLPNFDQMVGLRVDKNVWNVVDVHYPGDSISIDALFKMNDTSATGKTNLMSLINGNTGKFAFSALSQGGIVASNVYKEIQSGSLVSRQSDFLGAVTFGNPCREAGHTIPGGWDPGGHGTPSHGILTTDLLSGTPDKWWDFANNGDMVSDIKDDTYGIGSQHIFQWLFSNTTGPESFIADVTAAFNAGAFTGIYTLVSDVIAVANRLLSTIGEGLDIALLFLPYLNVDPHLRYHLPYTQKPGNIELSAVDLAVDYINDLGYKNPIPNQPAFIPGTNIIGQSEPDRFRFICEEARTGNILSRDLTVQHPKVLRALSGPASINFDINYQDYENAGIYFKPWGHWIHVEKVIQGVRKVWASGITQPSDIDKDTGIMHLKATGFAGYPKATPWLDNWNPLVIDPFEVVARIWNHVQSYSNGNLEVTVYPISSGLEMLPGYAFDGSLLNLDFFAVFIRASDKQDCQDWIDKLSRDIPFDYVEQSDWNVDRTGVTKKIYLGYPIAGVQQDNLAFIVNENVIEAVPHIESETDWASDVIIDGWAPGTEYSSQLTNADPLRYRRVVMEDDARINSDERAAAWARRKLTRRQTPAYWESIIVQADHPNAPFGSYDVGDRIWVKGPMPWVGDVNQLHKVIAVAVDEDKGDVQLTLTAEGAFNYDPIYYQGSNPTESKTIIIPTMPLFSVASDAPTIG